MGIIVVFAFIVGILSALLIMYLNYKKQDAKFLLSQGECENAVISAVKSGSREVQEKCLDAVLASSVRLAGECIKVFINEGETPRAIDLLSSDAYVRLDRALEDHERAVEKHEVGNRKLDPYLADEYRKISYNRIVILVGIAHRFLNRKQIDSFNYLVIGCWTRKDKKATKALAVVARKYNLRSLIL